MELQPELFLLLLHWIKDRLPNDRNEIYDFRDIVIPPYTPTEVQHHIELLIDTGYIKTYSDGICIKSLSMEGYNLLEMVKNDTVWNRVKKKISEIGMDALPVLIQVAIEQTGKMMK